MKMGNAFYISSLNCLCIIIFMEFVYDVKGTAPESPPLFSPK